LALIVAVITIETMGLGRPEQRQGRADALDERSTAAYVVNARIDATDPGGCPSWEDP